MNGNKFVEWLLRSPLRELMGETMLITVTGRKTGRRYSIPVGYFEEDGYLWVLSSRDRTWWRNVRRGAAVDLFLHGQEACGFAELVLDEQAVAGRLAAYLRHSPMAARPLGARVQAGILNSEDARRLAGERLFIRIKLVPA